MTRKLAIIALLGVVLRIGVLVSAPYPAQDDTRQHLAMGQNLLLGWGYSYDYDGDGIPEFATREPGYPTLLAGLLFVADESALRVASLVQIIAAAGATWATYAIGAATWNPQAGLVAAALYAFWPGLVIESTIASHEGTLIALVPLILLMAIRSRQRDAWSEYFLLGMLLAVAALTKQTALGLVACTVFALVADAPRSIVRWQGVAVTLMAFAVAVTPWTLRNMRASDRMQQMISQVMPQVSSATADQMRAKGDELHKTTMKDIRVANPNETVVASEPASSERNTAATQPAAARPQGPWSSSPTEGQRAGAATSHQDNDVGDATLWARLTYEMYEMDPRRGLSILPGSGGEVGRLLSSPRALLTRVFMNITNGSPRDIYLVPYENRYIEYLFPGTPRLRSVPLAIDAGVLIKLFLVALFLGMQVLSLVASATVIGRKSAWPVLIAFPYFYVLPLLHSGPLNRFFFVATPIALVMAAVMIVRIKDWMVSRVAAEPAREFASV